MNDAKLQSKAAIAFADKFNDLAIPFTQKKHTRKVCFNLIVKILIDYCCLFFVNR